MSTAARMLDSYVPRIVMLPFAEAQEDVVRPRLDRYQAVVLFADISGFTSLAAQLAQRGPLGAELLSQALNSSFRPMVDTILAHGGDVVKFAGDALLALWPTTDLTAALFAAAQAALAIQELHAVTPAHTPSFRLRIGIAVGSVSLLQIGGVYGRWETVVSGAPLHDVATAEQCAHPGDVVLTPEAWELVASASMGQAVTAHSPYMRLISLQRLDTPVYLPLAQGPNAAALLRGYLPGAILSQLDAGQHDWLAELRRVTVLFINLPDFTDDAALRATQQAMVRLQEALYRYEGSVNKLSLDEKGVTLVAVFGLPPLTHEDDPLRALLAAQAIQATLRDQGLRSAIGVATGQVFCGVIGSPARCEYTVIGDTVNVAARLMQAAAGTLFCDEPTARRAQHRIAFAPALTMQLKGKAEPVAVYEPRSADQAPQAAASPLLQANTMVGRTRERHVLSARLHTLAHEATGGVVIIEGEAGIGKSQLLADVRTQAAALPVAVLEGAGDAIAQTTTYHAWRPLLGQLLGLTAATEPTDGRAAVLAQLAADPQQVAHAPLLAAILPFEWPDNPLTHQMSDQVRADNLHALVARLIEVWTVERPVVLLIEDAHWLDSASWTLLRVVLRQVQPVLLVVTTRPLDDPPPLYAQLRAGTDTTLLRLNGLEPDALHALLARRLGVQALPDAVAQLIAARSDGNPFFSEELLFELRDAGLLIVEGDQCQLAPQAGDLAALDLPATVQGVITSRIDRLTPEQQLILKVGSVIGRSFGLTTLTTVHPITREHDALIVDLGTLERLDLTPLEHPAPDTRYIFKHSITQEVAYSLMLFAQRRVLHQAVAHWYEQTYVDNLAPFAALLAYHWRRAEVPHHTLRYLGQAGEQALRTYANREAISFFEEALELASQHTGAVGATVRAGWLQQLGEAYFRLGRFAASRAAFHSGLDLLGHPLATTVLQQGRELLQSLVQHGLSRLGRRPAQPAPAEVSLILQSALTYERLGQMYYYENQTLGLAHAMLQELVRAESVGLSPVRARAYASTGIVLAAIPAPPLAEHYFAEAMAQAQQLGSLETQALIAELTGLYCLGVGHWARAHVALELAMTQNRQIGNNRNQEESTAIRSYVCLLEGDVRGMAALADEAYALAHRNEDQQMQILCRLAQAQSHLLQGERGIAQRYLDELTAQIAQAPAAERLCYGGLAALVASRAGEREVALAMAGQTQQLMAQSRPTASYIASAYSNVAETYITLWQQQGGYDQSVAAGLRAACATLHQFAQIFPIGQPKAWRSTGWHWWLHGQPLRAQRAWRRSLRTAERLAMPYDSGLAHAALAQSARGAIRRAHLAHAIAHFARLGATDDLRRTVALTRAQVASNEHADR